MIVSQCQIIAQSVYCYYLALAYYHEDLEFGRIKGKKFVPLAELRGKIIQYANVLMTTAKDPILIERAKYHFLAQSFLEGKENEVATSLSKKSFAIVPNSPYQQNLIILGLLVGLGEANPDPTIAQINKMSGMEGPSYSILLFAQARALAGFDLVGKRRVIPNLAMPPICIKPFCLPRG